MKFSSHNDAKIFKYTKIFLLMETKPYLFICKVENSSKIKNCLPTFHEIYRKTSSQIIFK